MATSQSSDGQYGMDTKGINMQSTWERCAPGVVQYSTTEHSGQTSINKGATDGSRTANGTNVTGDFKAHTHSMPTVWYTKPQSNTDFVGTTMHKGENSITTPGSSTARGYERGEKQV